MKKIGSILPKGLLVCCMFYALSAFAAAPPKAVTTMTCDCEALSNSAPEICRAFGWDDGSLHTCNDTNVTFFCNLSDWSSYGYEWATCG
jgi:hypothetical protein